MSGANDIGISPALLQAITQTISTRAVTHSADTDQVHNGDHGNTDEGQEAPGNHGNIIISRDPNHHQIIKVEGKGHSLEGLSEAISAMGQQAFQAGDAIFVLQNDVEGGEVVTEEHVYTDDIHKVDKVVDSPLVIPKMEKVDIVRQDERVVKHIRLSEAYPVADRVVASSVATPVTSNNISSVISDIASQISGQVHGKKDTLGTSSEQDNRHKSAPSQVHTVVHSTKKPYITQAPSVSSHPVRQGELTVPSPVSDVTVTAADNVVTETVIQTSYTPQTEPVVQHVQLENKKVRIIEMPELTDSIENGTTIILNPGDMADGTVFKAISTEQGAIVYRTTPQPVPTGVVPNRSDASDGCPVCGDKVSGYHYGIYSCESCKGFFKRTVQNKKAFICHRMGECMVSIANRKKCPACRFKRCLVAGMKLEAIREDRMRGGRSSYDGCSPHVRPVKLPREHKRNPSSQARPGVIVNPIILNTPGGPITIPTSPGSSGGVTTASIPRSTTTTTTTTTSQNLTPIAPRPVDLNQVQPQTPQLLEDLMAVESLMMDEEEEQACCEGKMSDTDPNMFGSLLHFADHCLYKIVRWARNLPDFANVSTDDQIILLQNCWAELLCLCCCWKSIRCPQGFIKLSHGRMLSVDQAVTMNIQEEIQRLLDFSDSLRRLETDNYEFVALKALLLFSPDVRNLKDESVVRRYQDRLTEALMVYTTTNSPKKTGKFCELLARLPELTRACVVGKDQLNQRQLSGEVPQYSLLSELLKGDIAVG